MGPSWQHHVAPWPCGTGALGEITLPCSENVVRSLLKHCYGLPYDANLSLEDELEPWHSTQVFDLFLREQIRYGS